MAPKNGSKATIREVYDLVRDQDQKRLEVERAQDKKREDMERRLVEAINGAVGGLGETLVGLRESVDDHHKTLHLYGLTKNPKFWGYGALVFVIVNVVVDAGRPFVAALIRAWTGIQLP